MKLTAIVTAYRRVDQTLVTLCKLVNCLPSPDEILIHVDGDQADCAKAIRDAFPGVQVIVSEQNIGPGGARNKLIAAAKHELVASFDDDSHPLDGDYFARAATLMAQFPEASILNAAVYHQGETIEPDARRAAWVADFSGGACVYRRSAFLATTGYVPLPLAYGMEEVDFAVRLRAQGGRILQTPWLRVFHDTNLQHHFSPAVTAASIANLALLTYLRYPLCYWPIGLGQIINRVRWLIPHGRKAGIWSGLTTIPRHCWRHRRFRQVVSLAAIRSYFQLRRQSVPVALA